MQKFASDEMLKKIVPGSDWGVRMWKMLLFSCGIAAIIIGIARPRWGLYFQDVQNYGRDVVVLLDLSKSMLAEDVQPTRIERAKKDIEDLVDALKGDRIALVAFAGRVETRCPLTLDYNFFKWALDECHPGVVALGGTAIGDAIREGIKLFDKEEEDSRRTKAILLITDGEDHETAPLEAAKLARKNNITIFTIGFGDDKQGARIPVTTAGGRKEYLRDSEGRIVWSRLNDQLLRQISLATKGGVYFPVKTRNINMVGVYRDYIAQMEAKVHQSAKKPQKRDRFQIFVLLGFIILLLESLVMEGSLRAKVTVLIMCVVLCGCSGEDNEAFSLNEQARKLYQSGEYEKAKEKFQEAEVASPENSTVLYNIANALYKQKKWKEAKDYYQQSTYNVKNNNEQLFRTAFNEGCTYFREAQELMEKNSNKIQDIINLLQQSLRHFRKALQYQKEDAATLHNLRFVKLILKNYLDKLHKKQQEQQKKQETIQALLALLRRNQIMMNYQSKVFVREKHSLKELAVQQKKQMEIFDKLEKKLQEKMKAVQDENQANMFKMQMQMLRTSLENLAVKMDNDDISVIQDQETFLSSLDPFWELMASADLVINEDILLQTLVVNDLQSEEKDFAAVVRTADDHQALAILATTLFEKKFAELVKSIAEQKKMLQQKQNKQNNTQGSGDPKLPEIDEEEVQRLTKQAMLEQGQAKKFLEETQQLSAEKEARKALETLQKIAEKLGAQKQPPQKQQQKQDKKKQQQKQQQNKKKQQQKQQQKQQNKKQSKRQAEKMLQKIKKRMKDNKEKKQQSDYNSIGVDNDW